MIYKYRHFTEEGPNGYTLHARLGEDDTLIGVIDGWTYVHSNAHQEQDARIQFQQVAPTDAEKQQLRDQRKNKEFARMKLKSVGDIEDFIADAMKLIEFNMMLTARLAGDLWGTNPIDPAIKSIYAARNQTFLDAVDAGAITLRGNFDDMDTVMQRLLVRISETNQIVRDNYIAELQRLEIA